MVDQMELMGDRELLAVLEEYSDSRGIGPADSLGWAGHIAVQLEELSKKDPGRIFRILPELQTGRHELAAGAALLGLSQNNDMPPMQALDWIHATADRGFKSSNFRERLCWSIIKIAERTKGLPDRTIALLITIARNRIKRRLECRSLWRCSVKRTTGTH